MACNSCSKAFSLLRKEKGCPSCGFSYCSNCLKYRIFVPKLNSEAKVCIKCERVSKSNAKPKVEPPDAYYKRIGTMDDTTKINSNIGSGNAQNTDSGNSIDQEISNRLQKLKEESCKIVPPAPTTENIANRLQKIKGDLPTTSDAELQSRLANLRGLPISTLQSNPVIVQPDNRSEQEQVEDLMKQYMEHAKIDGKYQEDFQGVLDNIQARLQNLKNTEGSTSGLATKQLNLNLESEDDKDILNKILEKAKLESRMEPEDLDPLSDPAGNELPFCEICNEDATMRCVGCKYLFCRQCFNEHKDEDEGCDKYEPYSPPKTFIS